MSGTRIAVLQEGEGREKVFREQNAVCPNRGSREIVVVQNSTTPIVLEVMVTVVVDRALFVR
jgi:hypothetical protein